MSVIVVGDLHGSWSPINKLINKKKPDIVLQCGDYGYWEPYHNTKLISDGTRKPWNQYGLKNGKAKVYFCDGNHEHFHALWKRVENNDTEIQPNVFYMPRKTILALPDNRNVMFMGGAESIDRGLRTPGLDWFPEETIKYSDVTNLPNDRVDIVISHTCPTEFEMRGTIDTANLKFNDPSKEALSIILNYYKPKLWYFGHYHKQASGYTKGCKWYALSMPNMTGWWRWIDNERSN